MDLRKPDFDKAELRKAYAEVEDSVDISSEISSHQRRLRSLFMVLPISITFPREQGAASLFFRRDNSPYPVAAIGLKGLDPEEI